MVAVFDELRRSVEDCEGSACDEDTSGGGMNGGCDASRDRPPCSGHSVDHIEPCHAGFLDCSGRDLSHGLDNCA